MIGEMNVTGVDIGVLAMQFHPGAWTEKAEPVKTEASDDDSTDADSGDVEVAEVSTLPEDS